MEFEEYRIMHDAEDVHWWYHGLRGVMYTMLGLDRPHAGQPLILDAGCGTGGTLRKLQQSGFNNTLGFDYSADALHFCKERGLDNVCQGSLMGIPFPSNTFSIVISCDVVNDGGLPDEMLALREMYRVLKPGGRVFLNLPAYTFLRGEHDMATSVVRRYTAGSISRKLEQAGFRVRQATHWNMFLFPVVLAVRLVSRVRGLDPEKQARSDINVPPKPANMLLTAVLNVERALLRHANLPFGSSVAVVAVKPRTCAEC